MIWNFGSINLDLVYRLPHLPAPGETLATLDRTEGLGGKGANQSVAAAKAGATVAHIGAVGADGKWARDRIAGYGVDVSGVATVPGASGHAVIYVDADAENSIVIYPGANGSFEAATLEQGLERARPGDFLLLQNETNLQDVAAGIARGKGLRVVYSAAPFDIQAVRAVLPHIDILAMNHIEAAQLSEAMGLSVEELPVPAVLVTHGADGATYRDQATGQTESVSAFSVKPVDTTGAGDCFAGYFVSGLDEGMAPAAALRLAAAASAIKVTRPGAADGIPLRAEVEAFLKAQS